MDGVVAGLLDRADRLWLGSGSITMDRTTGSLILLSSILTKEPTLFFRHEVDFGYLYSAHRKQGYIRAGVLRRAFFPKGIRPLASSDEGERAKRPKDLKLETFGWIFILRPRFS